MKHAISVAAAFCSLAAFLLFPAMALAGRQSNDTVRPAQQQAFQLGFALQSPATQTEEFLQAVKGLKELSDDKSADAVASLAKDSAALRKVEARSYEQASQLLRALSAPPDIQAWAAASAKKFDSPLILSKEAKKSDPDTAAILGAIDESQEVKGESDGHMASITAWLKLSQGADAVWSMALGELTAGMHSAIVASRSLALSRADIFRLRDSAPIGTSIPILNALVDLSPKVGNLAGLIHAPDTQIAPKNLKEPEEAILKAYSAQKFVDVINRKP